MAAGAADGADALACTDRDGLYGAVMHWGACREHGLGPVLGAGLAPGLDPETVDGAAKQLWNQPASALRKTPARRPELREFVEQVAPERQLDLLVDLAERLDRLPRHISMHPCGAIPGDRSLRGRTPVQTGGAGMPMSQFDQHDMDPMGLLELDLLGVRMQSALARADELRRRLGSDRQLEVEACFRSRARERKHRWTSWTGCGRSWRPSAPSASARPTARRSRCPPAGPRG